MNPKLRSLPGPVTLVLALLAGASCKSNSSGAAAGSSVNDRDDLVRSTFAALGRGDVDALMKGKYVDGTAMHGCDLRQEVERQEFERAVLRERSARFEVVQIRERWAPQVQLKGSPAFHGCALKANVILHRLTVRLRVEREGQISDGSATLVVVQDGLHWGATPPRIEGCSAAVAQLALVPDLRVLEPDFSRQADLMKACTVDRWSDSVLACFRDVRSESVAEVRSESVAEVGKCADELPVEARIRVFTGLLAMTCLRETYSMTEIRGCVDELPVDVRASVLHRLLEMRRAGAATTTPVPNGSSVDLLQK